MTAVRVYMVDLARTRPSCLTITIIFQTRRRWLYILRHLCNRGWRWRILRWWWRVCIALHCTALHCSVLSCPLHSQLLYECLDPEWAVLCYLHLPQRVTYTALLIAHRQASRVQAGGGGGGSSYGGGCDPGTFVTYTGTSDCHWWSSFSDLWCSVVSEFVICSGI
jgi:hypothetical protein